MGTMYWLRLGFMMLILVAVVWSMRRLNSAGDPQMAVSLCPSRIAWVELFGDNSHIEQHDGKWIRIRPNATAEELEPIAVEKWLSRFCSFTAQSVSSGGSSTAGLAPLLTIGYVAGKPEVLLKSNVTGFFSVSGRKFSSSELGEIMISLPTLPPAKSSDSP